MARLPVARMVVFVAVLLSVSSGARGFFVDFDTDPSGNALSSGEILTNQYAAWGVTFSALENGSTVDSLLILNSEVYGNSWANAPDLFGSEAWDILRIEFASPVTNVEWLTFSLGSEFITFSAYDAEGNLLETVLPSGDPVSTAFSVSGISRIDAEQPSEEYFWAMDNLSFAAVPEPSTFVLWWLFGTVGVAWAWRRKRRP
ncbi:MAG: PEP-CTERM sorting domain-containing protein [Pirellulaceae bacterium]